MGAPARPIRIRVQLVPRIEVVQCRLQHERRRVVEHIFRGLRRLDQQFMHLAP